MKKRVLGSIALSAMLLTGFTGCGDNETSKTELETLILDLETASKTAIEASLVGVVEEDKIPFGDGSFSPFERVAVLDVVKDANGNVDYNATNAKVASLAQKFAVNVANVNEPAEDNATFKASDWIIIDKKKVDVNLTVDDIKSHILVIPTAQSFNPNFSYSATNTRKVQVVELCNPSYAGQAAGFEMVGGANGAKVPNGSYHATALPCEVAIYSDNKAIYVDMLNPETIFTLFFTEVFSHDVMNNTDFRSAMMALPTQVKAEISTMIYNWLDGQGEAYHKTAIKMGPIYSAMSKAVAIPKEAAPYNHFKYTNTVKEFTVTDAQNLAKQIMENMTIHGTATAGQQAEPLFSTLPSVAQTPSVNPSWRSARHEPFKVPGGIWVIEACSPVYAKEALNTGAYHTPALPCEIGVQVNPDDNKSIDVSVLNPDFMFKALFADGMADMNTTTIAGFQTIIDNINGDLNKIVEYTMEQNGTLSTGVQITPITY